MPEITAALPLFREGVGVRIHRQEPEHDAGGWSQHKVEIGKE